MYYHPTKSLPVLMCLDDDGETKQFFTIPYVKGVFENFKKLAKKT